MLASPEVRICQELILKSGTSTTYRLLVSYYPTRVPTSTVSQQFLDFLKVQRAAEPSVIRLLSIKCA